MASCLFSAHRLFQLFRDDRRLFPRHFGIRAVLADDDARRVGLERDLLRGQSEVRKLLAEVGSGTSSNGSAANSPVWKKPQPWAICRTVVVPAAAFNS
jgi:hypothetical protein